MFAAVLAAVFIITPLHLPSKLASVRTRRVENNKFSSRILNFLYEVDGEKRKTKMKVYGPENEEVYEEVYGPENDLESDSASEIGELSSRDRRAELARLAG